MVGIVNSIFGGSDPPPAPDYTAAAKATAAGDLEAAKFATRANRVNQYTPWGSQTYQELPGDRWSQTVNLTPQAQQTLDRQMALSDQYADVAQTGFNRARQTLENPNIDVSNLPELRGIDFTNLPDAPINAGTTAQEAIMKRLQPQIDRQEEALRARLANQGITLGSNAYNTEQAGFETSKNDLLSQAALKGIDLDRAARASAIAEQQANLSTNADIRGRSISEQAALKDRPLNLINALRSGSQVTSPTFNSFAQQQTTKGADILGATGQQFTADTNRFNAIQARRDKQNQAIFDIATAGMTGGMGGGMGSGSGIFGIV